MELIRYGQEVRTIFDLFGSKENDMTFSLGWVLSRSEAFLRLLVADVCGSVLSFIDGKQVFKMAKLYGI